MEETADDDHRMRPQHIDDDRTAQLGEVIHADDGVVVPGQDRVQPCLALDPLIGVGAVLEDSPCDVGNETSEGKAKRGSGFERFLDEGEHSVGVEAPITQKGLLHRRHLELTAMLCRRHDNAGRLQSPEVFLPQLGIDDMEGPVAALESLLDEWKQYPVLLVRIVKEGTDMTWCAKHRAGEPNRSVALIRDSAATLGLVIDGIHRARLNGAVNEKRRCPKRTLTLASLLPLPPALEGKQAGATN